MQLILSSLATGLIEFFISSNPVFSNGPRTLPKNPPDCIILDNWVFDNLISVDNLLEKDLWRFKTCLLVNNNLWGKLVSSSPITFDDNLKTNLENLGDNLENSNTVSFASSVIRTFLYFLLNLL